MTAWMLTGRRLGQQGASQKWFRLQPVCEPLQRECDSTVARAETAKAKVGATLVKHPEPRTIVHGEEYVREPAR
jgi:hypothetical protein